jgi:hypothetical protein
MLTYLYPFYPYYIFNDDSKESCSKVIQCHYRRGGHSQEL